ncbi:ParB N-terminal domain-containing protein [Streptomyces sp. MZ04]|uniref:ParB/RepB/Spo0J family partition protein n=1 Tax=Streptomyces sp. MZ04 TaxID=2559236 RepID=UPI001432D3BD|nr:ParB N-terminal domain-containing protein [Streptomyces sp. MZ04]
MSTEVELASKDLVGPVQESLDVYGNGSLDRCPVVWVRIDSLVLEGSPRQAGEDENHTRLLAESGNALPSIIVHRPTMRVIDGMHRVQAALLNGKEEISARLLECDERVAFVLAVQANITHGLPLSHSDRKLAAERIIASNPQWSDRAVAAASGLSDKTVARIRAQAAADSPESGTRLGRDGRRRPVDSADRRRLAAAMIREQPGAGNREIARVAGLSPATVRDVRHRTMLGEDPVPARYRQDDQASQEPSGPQRRLVPSRPGSRTPVVHMAAILGRLRSDPALRMNDTGRHILRWLHHHTINPGEMQYLGHHLPDHWTNCVADLARGYATAWGDLAEQLDKRSSRTPLR